MISEWVVTLVAIYGIIYFGTVLSVEDNLDVLSRLSSVENAISKIHADNDNFHSQNERLRADNNDLRRKLMLLEKTFRVKSNDFDAKQNHLSADNDDLRKMISILETSLQKKEKEFSEMKTKLESAETKLSSFSMKISALAERNRIEQKDQIVDSPLNETSVQKQEMQTPDTSPLDNKDPNMNHPFQQKISQESFGTTISKYHDGITRSNSKRLLDSTVHTSNKISFSADMDGSQSGLGTNQVLVFETVNNNEGGGYDHLTGVFTCPVSGTYFFIAHILSYNGDHFWAQIVVNNIAKVNIGADARGSNAYGAGSSSLITHCNKGDDVWVRRKDGSNVNGEKYPNFGGFLLWSD